MITEKMATDQQQKLPVPKEGDMFKVIELYGRTFEIRYGYYEDFERKKSEPIPVYPDLKRTPIYGISGKLIVTHMQDVCPHFKPQAGDDTEVCCGCCEYYPKNRQMIDVCLCKENYAAVQMEGEQ